MLMYVETVMYYIALKRYWLRTYVTYAMGDVPN